LIRRLPPTNAVLGCQGLPSLQRCAWTAPDHHGYRAISYSTGTLFDEQERKQAMREIVLYIIDNLP